MKPFMMTAACAVALATAPAFAQHQGHDMPAEPVDHSQMDHSKLDHGTMDHGEMAHDAAKPSTGSGTSRLPGNENAHTGMHVRAGEVALMLHGYAWGVYSDQGGPRGDSKTFVNSMAMLQADYAVSDTVTVQARTMMSLEPLMRHDGYPNLFASGEVAYGAPLVDRQHPHDLFMELAARVDVKTGFGGVFLYGGPVAEPALGPSAFMHRASARLNPEAPITHHWFDSTHITYGVVTAGIATDTLQFEASAFRGREPDEFRWNIERPKFDSWSVRATWNPAPAWSAQVSYGRLKSPEEAHPGEDEGRFTASASYTKAGLAVTAAFSAKNRLPGPVLSAWLVEATYDIDDRHAVFGRYESLNNDELFPDDASPLHEVPFRVSKFAVGYGYTIPVTSNVFLALGASASVYAKPAALDGAYGKAPKSFTLFAKLSLGR